MTVSENAEPFTTRPVMCPKCRGDSTIDRCVKGVPYRNASGEFEWSLGTSPEEHLVVRCHTCGYERLMNIAAEVD